ncbi:MAG TPA: hypothetical protein PKD37_02355 [Oligoflexia bacterium]|nr:hypothetical protein [Oligoflexia bacterium]HMP26812.1 hypothetical protein [Oligoflexia bacterium]
MNNFLRTKIELSRKIAASRLPQTLFFYGSNFELLSSIASWLAQVLTCEKKFIKDGSYQNCGSCKECFFNSQNTSPSIITVSLSQPDSSKVENIKELLLTLNLNQASGFKRVVILKNPELISLQAANALLKILEEPPGNVTFILLSENASKILPTIRSRAQLIRVEEDQMTNSQNPANSMFALREADRKNLIDKEVLFEELQTDIIRLLNNPSYPAGCRLANRIINFQKNDLKNCLITLSGLTLSVARQARSQLTSFQRSSLCSLALNLLNAERLIEERNLNSQLTLSAVFNFFVAENITQQQSRLLNFY